MLLLSSRSSSGSGIALLASSVAVLGAAFFLWEARSQAASGASSPEEGAAGLLSSTRLAHGNLPQSATYSAPGRDSEAALHLLRRSYQADNSLSYGADVLTTAMYGSQKMETKAHLMRAPRSLTISYLSGDRRGLEGGYNERWFWRRDSKTAPMQAYASVAYRPAEMAAQRFARLILNYNGTLVRDERVAGRLCDVVEVRRRQPLEGTKGPFKRLWLDRETSITLRSDSFNCQGNLVQRSTLIHLQLQPKFSSETFVPPQTMFAIARKSSWNTEELGNDRAKVAKMTSLYPPEPSWLPAGFAFDSVGMQHTSLAKGAPLAALSRYGDGLNVVTLFAFKTAPHSSNAKNASAKGDSSCTFGSGAMAMRQMPNGVTLLAISDLPTAMLKRVLDSTRLR